MTGVTGISVNAAEGAVKAASFLPVGLTPFHGMLLLFVAVLSVRAFVPPRPFVPASQTQPAKRKRKARIGLRGTVQMLVGQGQPQASTPKAAPQSHKLLQVAFTALLDEVIVFDPDSFRVSFMNSRAEARVVGMGLKKTRVRFPDLLPAANREAVTEAIRNLRRSELDSVVFELNSAGVPLELTLKLIREDGAEDCLMAIFRDISGRISEAKAQSDYVATLSHEMRTPLTSIKGAMDLIASGHMGALSGNAAATLGVAQRNVDRLLRLTNDILDLEKLDAGKMQCDFEEVRIGMLVENAIEEIQGYARKFDVSIRAEMRCQDCRAYADPTRLAQVLANLLSNAIKFSQPQTEVGALVHEVGGNIRVSVVDHGPGIPENLQADLFVPYSQGPQVQRKVAGTGLGLSIAKRIVEAHGGSIGFVSEPGQGSTFYFDLPKAGCADEVAA
jgi:signal transduction histidine kinase